MKKKLNILVCPLNWGLGHASRDIPIINEFLNRGHNVIVAGSKNPIELIRTEFSKLKFIYFEGLNVSYPKNGSFVFYFLLRIPILLWGIFKEHIQLKKIIKEQKIDVVISDNRYGLWNKNVYSIFITHQLFIKMPENWKNLEQFVFKINQYFINKYDKCWLPDYENQPYLAGELSHKYSVINNVSYVGLLSRFTNKELTLNTENNKYEVIAIISGPEPHRTLFENILINQLQKLNKNCLLITGKPIEASVSKEIGKLKIVSHLSTSEILNAIENSKVIVSRSGYSTIMDLIALKRTAILVPTPNQTEQEYLAEYYSKMKIFFCVTQNKFDLNEAINRISEYSPLNIKKIDNLLSAEIDKIEKQFN